MCRGVRIELFTARVLCIGRVAFRERTKAKGSPYSTAERRVPELIPVLGSQPARDVYSSTRQGK